MAQMAISAVENGDYGEVKRILSLLQKPFDDLPAATTSGAESRPIAHSKFFGF